MLLVVGMLALGLGGCGEKMTDEDRTKAMEQCAATITEKAAEVRVKGPGTEESFEACGQKVTLGLNDSTLFFMGEYGGSNAVNVSIGGKDVICVLSISDKAECKIKE